MKALLNLFYVFVGVILAGCSSGNGRTTHELIGDTLTARAEMLTMVDCGDWTAVEISVPWSNSAPLARYAILREDVEVPADFTVIRAPIERSVVFSAVYASALAELGCIDAVCGVADGSFYQPSDTIARLIDSGKITDVGSSMAPMIEKIIDLQPSAVLLSPYEDVASVGVDRAAIPQVWMADYLENDPLGRAEWILLLGELYGRREQARTILSEAVTTYNDIKKKTESVAEKPLVITEKPMSGYWYVPGGESYVARMIADSGGSYPWADSKSAGSISLDEAAVIDKGVDADVWLIKDTKNLTTETLLTELPRARVLQPYPASTFFCNTLTTPYYNDIAFHPHRILADYAAILHPELFPDYVPQYYQKLK